MAAWNRTLKAALPAALLTCMGAFSVAAQEAASIPAVQLAAADLPADAPTTDSVPTVQFSARLVDTSGRVVDVAEVEGTREEFYDLLLQLSAALALDAGDVPAAGAAEVDAAALYALGQLFEARGYKDLAADAYQAVMRYHPEFEGPEDRWHRLLGRWELNAYAGLLNDEPEYTHNPGEDEFRRDAVLGVRGSYHFTRQAFVQAEVANALAVLHSGGKRQNINAFPLWASVGYDFKVTHDFQIFPTLGAGAVIWKPDATEGSADFALSYGVGGRLFLTRNSALRTDVRLHHVPNALGPTLEELDLRTGKTLWALELTFGVSWFPAG
jgi:tetratricopeptide (TPR) repeat protein